jgi:lysine biosynthesis protein LysW
MDNSQKKTIKCPECDSPIQIPDGTDTGTIVDCPTCGVTNEFISINPFELIPLEEEK